MQLREHAQIPTRSARLLAAIRANSLTLRQSARWQQLAQSSWRNQCWALRISAATGCAENHYIGKMISQHYIVCDDDTWLSNYYHTIYMWLVHLCKDTWWRISLLLHEIHECLSASIISAYFTCIRIAEQLREHAQIPTRPARLLAAIRANSLTLRQSARWQQLAQSSWRNQCWVLRISTATGCAENCYIRCNDSTRLPCATIAPDDLTIIILFISSLRIYARNLMMERTILVLHENVSRETSVKAIRVIINTTI